MRTLGIILLALVSACDDLSPFISEEGLADRLDLDSDGVENARDCAPTDPSFTTLTFWRDLDGDGFGAGEPTQTCPDNDDFALPVREGFAVKAGDCNDGNNTVYPGAREVCDFADNNCDDEVDEGFASHWCRDADEDGYGDANDTREDCGVPNGFVADCTDCDDTPGAGAGVHPDAEEVCDDLVDNDCDGTVDNALTATQWFADADNDGAGDPSKTLFSCAEQPGFVTTDGDCDDGNPNIGSGVPEACEDGVDNDCDGETDTDAVESLWYADADEDGYGDPAVSQSACAPPDGFAGNALDCDDTRAAVKPGVAEVCNNGLDDNCDGSVNECSVLGQVSINQVAISWMDGNTSYAFGDSLLDCDANGDGSDDLIIGLPRDFSDNQSNMGSVSIFAGPFQNGVQEVTFNLRGFDRSRFGTSFDCLSLEDDVRWIAIGAPGSINAGESTQSNGRVFLYKNPLTTYQTYTQAEMVFTGNSQGTLLGYAIQWNSRNMLFVGAPGLQNEDGVTAGGVFVFDAQGSGTRNQTNALLTLTGLSEGSFTGGSILTNFLNQDDESDLIIGSPKNGLSQSGATSIILGPIERSGAIDQAGATMMSNRPSDWFGTSLCGNVDVTGDQIHDIVVGAPGDVSTAGSISIISGTGPFDLIESATHIFSLTDGDRLGYSVSCGDLNGDGIGDIAIGSPGFDGPQRNDTGAVFIMYGPVTAGGEISQVAQATIFGASEKDALGWNIRMTSDLTGDGIPDLVGVAENTKPLRRAYVIPGLGL